WVSILRPGRARTQKTNSCGQRPTAVSQCLCPEADSAKWIFPQERATFHRVQKRIHSLRNRSKGLRGKVRDYSPSMILWIPVARPVAGSQETRAAQIFGLPFAASNLPGIPVR